MATKTRHTLYVRMTDSDLAALRRIATERGSPVAEVVRRALKAFLKEQRTK